MVEGFQSRSNRVAEVPNRETVVSPTDKTLGRTPSGCLNLPDRQEHRDWRRTSVGLTFENFEGHESELPVERDGFGFGVDKNAGASVVLRKPDRELQHEAEELLSQALPTRGLIDGER